MMKTISVTLLPTALRLLQQPIAIAHIKFEADKKQHADPNGRHVQHCRSPPCVNRLPVIAKAPLMVLLLPLNQRQVQCEHVDIGVPVES